MIIDHIHRIAFYEKLHPGFKAAFDFLRQTNLAELSEGRHDIEGSRVYAILAEGVGRPRSGAMLETHRKYIDIQLSVHGTDMIGWKPLPECVGSNQGYDAEKDIEFYTAKPDTWISAPPDCFVIFFPEDAHAPMAATDETIKKLVIKIAADW